MPRAIAARAMTLSRLIAASATTIAVAAAHRSRRAAPGSGAGSGVASRVDGNVKGDDDQRPGAEQLDQRHAEQRSGDGRQQQAARRSPRRSRSSPRAARRRGPRPLQATAISSALSAPSSRSTTKIWRGMTSQAAPAERSMPQASAARQRGAPAAYAHGGFPGVGAIGALWRLRTVLRACRRKSASGDSTSVGPESARALR